MRRRRTAASYFLDIVLSLRKSRQRVFMPFHEPARCWHRIASTRIRTAVEEDWEPAYIECRSRAGSDLRIRKGSTSNRATPGSIDASQGVNRHRQRQAAPRASRSGNRLRLDNVRDTASLQNFGCSTLENPTTVRLIPSAPNCRRFFSNSHPLKSSLATQSFHRCQAAPESCPV